MDRTNKMKQNDKAAAAAAAVTFPSKQKKAIISVIKRPRVILRPEMESLFFGDVHFLSFFTNYAILTKFQKNPFSARPGRK